MSMTILPGLGPDIGAGMVAAVAVTVLVTGAMKGAVGLGLSTGSVVVFSLLYGLESALCLLIAPTVATNLWQGAGGGHARSSKRFWPGLAAIVPGVWAGATSSGRSRPARPSGASGSRSRCTRCSRSAGEAGATRRRANAPSRSSPEPPTASSPARAACWSSHLSRIWKHCTSSATRWSR